MKKVLTIIPFFNVENILQTTIESILQQTYSNLHLCLVDDNSTDGSLEIAKLYEDHPKVTLLQNESNLGPYLSVNKGLYYFKDREWDYIHFHGADDVSDIRRFEKVIEYLNSDKKMLGCKTTFVRVHYDTNEIAYENGRQHITTSEGIAFYRRRVFEEIGYFDNTRYSGDTEYFWRLQGWIDSRKEKYFLGSHTEPLYLAYLHGNNLTTQVPIVDRTPYYKKIHEDIQHRKVTSNFYRQYEDR